MSPDRVIYRAASERDTIAFGRRLGRLLEPGDVLVLSGDLGVGKTCFAKGLAQGLDVPAGQVITSPSFALVNEYEGRCPFFHMDVYRLERVEEIVAAGLEEYLYQGGVTAIEWGERCPEILPEGHLLVRLSILGDLSREIVMEGSAGRALILLEGVNQLLG
ncbi:tRNA (adenosine(37)-N6)-threonylcarbamoyltransferase complex ATPase subunit type 1 TsaE [Desulfatiglans anilini]|uniref:tRNA (adenosine(37)-N6)-threonylcarbamoyltransferase complex ATPase subunit type 1 TsaE n=1 Tax=Desulfatiglans anilini TaxID=90728 RepID=UPI0003F53577|nr:tRNA (adenosine(37)-N6)-threonylcarbamoyltransferase complex ATPase subunit type 1 TsaE [Desulfatiglans anilini]